MKIKDLTTLQERTGVIYKIKCKCGDFYIGETGRSLAIRIKEHKVSAVWPSSTNQQLPKHAWQDFQLGGF